MVHVKPRELLETPNGKAEGNQQPSRESGRFNDYPKGVGAKRFRSAGLFPINLCLQIENVRCRILEIFSIWGRDETMYLV